MDLILITSFSPNENWIVNFLSLWKVSDICEKQSSSSFPELLNNAFWDFKLFYQINSSNTQPTQCDSKTNCLQLFDLENLTNENSKNSSICFIKFPHFLIIQEKRNHTT